MISAAMGEPSDLVGLAWCVGGKVVITLRVMKSHLTNTPQCGYSPCVSNAARRYGNRVFPEFRSPPLAWDTSALLWFCPFAACRSCWDCRTGTRGFERGRERARVAPPIV